MYRLKDVISRIRFATSTTDDLTGKTAQNLFTNKSIVQQLKFALDKYASYTRAIEGIYSTQAYTNTSSVEAPSDILRSKGLRYIFLYNKGLRYPLIDRNANNVYSNFYVQNITGIPHWFLYFADRIDLFPINNSDPTEGTLAKAIAKDEATIPMTADVTLAAKNGRITIGSEKIEYKYKTGAVLYECTRGIEGTIAASHNSGDTVLENNVHILYRKLHWSFDVPGDDRVDDVYANRAMEIADEHMEMIADYVSFKLLMKVDPGRAEAYKINLEGWLENAKYDVQKGRCDITKADNVRDSYWSERVDSPFIYW